jgi:hypothetical protein
MKIFRKAISGKEAGAARLEDRELCSLKVRGASYYLFLKAKRSSNPTPPRAINQQSYIINPTKLLSAHRSS